MQKSQGGNECGDSEAVWLEWKEEGTWWLQKGKADRPGPSGIPEGQAGEATFLIRAKGSHERDVSRWRVTE